MGESVVESGYHVLNSRTLDSFHHQSRPEPLVKGRNLSENGARAPGTFVVGSRKSFKSSITLQPGTCPTPLPD